MNSKNIIIIGVSVIALLNSCKNNNTNILEGKVKRETISIAPKYAGRIEKIFVHESQIVHKGDTLAILDIPEISVKLEQAEGASLSANSQYEMALHGATKDQKEQVNAAFNAAQEQYLFAEKSLKRIRNMYNDSLVSPQAFDEALTKFNMAKDQYDAAYAKKQEVDGGIRDEQVKIALGQKDQAEGAVKEAEIACKEKYIIAPKDMSVETIALREGELALQGYNIFIGYEVNSTYFRFTISESMINSVVKGNEYEVKLPFQSGKIFKAKLEGVTELGHYAFKSSSYPNYQLGEAVYELKLVPDNAKTAQLLYVNSTAILSLSENIGKVTVK